MSKLKAVRDRNWFGRRLRAAREAAKLSQEQLAERVDLTRLTIARYETGKLKPAFDRLEPMAEALSQPLWWFFTDQDEKPRAPGAISERAYREILGRLALLEEVIAQRAEHRGEPAGAREDRRTGYLGAAGGLKREDGLEQMRRAILEILETRFQELPADLDPALREIVDPDILRGLILQSATVVRLATFQKTLESGRG